MSHRRSSSIESRTSPSRISRIKEKEDLQNLNDRLAVYIDTVRRLEIENSRLNVQIKTSQETVIREVTTLKNVYENELSDVRKALDAMAKDKAKLQIDADKFKRMYDEASSKLLTKEKEIPYLENQVKSLELLSQDLQRRLNRFLNENKKLERALKDTQAERDSLSKNLTAAKRDLDNTNLIKVDLQNRLQSVKEELQFKETVHKKEMTETRSLKEIELTELSTQLRNTYEQKVSDSLRELREQYETQMGMNKNEIETKYETKIFEMQAKMENDSEFLKICRSELTSSKSNVHNLNSKNETLEKQILSLQNRIKDLEKMLERERIGHGEALKKKEDQIRNLRGEKDRNMAEFHDLLEIKISLDTEIAAYRKLLEGEELRINMDSISTPSGSPQFTSTPHGSLKRKRSELVLTSQDLQVSAKSKNVIEIVEQDLAGKFIKIFNRGEKDTSIGSWQLIQRAGAQEMKYTFPKTAYIKANSEATVWSANSGVTHSPPNNYLMKHHHSWLFSNALSTVLLNNNNEEMASINKSSKSQETFLVKHR